MSAIIGWDIGGAHLKAVWLNAQGELRDAVQWPCPLWRGLDQLQAGFHTVAQQFAEDWRGQRHVVTMTGELVDLFANRHEGVLAIAQVVAQKLGESTQFYAADAGFVNASQVAAHSRSIASTNWHASARLLAQQLPEAILVDMGSTTTDIIPIRGGKVVAMGLSDAERMCADTLIYTGVVRTPLMALANKLPFEGADVNVAAEYFATMADVYRLTGELDPTVDKADTADGKGKSLIDSARRLARMIGHDVEDRPMAAWQALAQICRQTQQAQLARALQKHRRPNDTVLGVGAGAFLIESLSKQMRWPYQGLQTLIPLAQDAKISVCFPAYAVARLAVSREFLL